jgi:hypothetical protein
LTPALFDSLGLLAAYAVWFGLLVLLVAPLIVSGIYLARRS